MIVMAQTSEQGWIVFDYEVGMYKQMSILCTNGCRNHFVAPIQNALAESMLLHLRIVVDMLLRKKSEDDDVTLSVLLPQFKSAHIEKLRSAYGSRNTEDSPCWTLNKMLAHATFARADTYDYTAMLAPLTPILLQVLLEVEKVRFGRDGRILNQPKTANP